MEKNKDTKEKIGAIVSEYRSLFPKDYDAVVRVVRQNRENASSAFAELKGSEFVHRPILQYSEILDNMFVMKLSTEEYKWFREKETARWFARKYPEFAFPRKI